MYPSLVAHEIIGPFETMVILYYKQTECDGNEWTGLCTFDSTEHLKGNSPMIRLSHLHNNFRFKQLKTEKKNEKNYIR